MVRRHMWRCGHGWCKAAQEGCQPQRRKALTQQAARVGALEWSPGQGGGQARAAEQSKWRGSPGGRE